MTKLTFVEAALAAGVVAFAGIAAADMVGSPAVAAAQEAQESAVKAVADGAQKAVTAGRKSKTAPKPVEAEVDATRTASVTPNRPTEVKFKARRGSVGASAHAAKAEPGVADADDEKEVAWSPSYHAFVARYAAEYGIPASLASAVITVESNGRVYARGKAGEIGLMQIKPATARDMGYKGGADGLFDPETNIRYGMLYLAKAHELAGGNTCGTILRYNAGHSAKRMNKRSAAYCSKVKLIVGS
jgi:soluble lytic murein transglycosylase-like protein